MIYLWSFIIGGLLCAIAQILIDKTKMTAARIMLTFLIAGIILSAFGLYQYIVDFAGAGATVPLSGFGYSLAKGVKAAIDEKGLLGIFTGGIAATAAGITAAIAFGLLAALVGRPKGKN